MKRSILLFFVILGIAGAQPNSAPAPIIVETGPEGVDPSGVLHLQSGNLPSVVEQVARAVPVLRDAKGQFTTMPNVIFSPEANAAMVSANLRLRDVSPVQALALVAAAAGCTIEPVIAPKEPGAEGGESEKIIGYRVTLTPTAQVVFGSKLPRSAAGAMPSATLKAAPQYFVQDNTEAPPSLVRVPAAESQRVLFIDRDAPAPAVEVPSASVNSVAQPAKPDELTVRVYALGTVLRGTPEEMKEKQAGVLTLIEEALQRADLSDRQPDVSFHSASKTLIVKANAQQHDIVDQIIRAMKENEQGDPSTAVRR